MLTKRQVKLWYGSTRYGLSLDDLLAVWTTHISSISSILNGEVSPNIGPAPVLTSIFPERDSGCYVEVQPRISENDSACRLPLDYFPSNSLLGLMSLDAFLNAGGDDVPNAKVLVCVTAVGEARMGRQNIPAYKHPHLTALPPATSKSTGSTYPTVSVGIRDQTATTTLTLYRCLVPSASRLVPNSTTLLLCCPKRTHSIITTTPRTTLELDPFIPPARALRIYSLRRSIPCNTRFPSHLFDVDSITSSPLRIKFTLASLAAFVEANPDELYAGYLAVILAEVNIVRLFERGRLFAMACCGMPIYANRLRGHCDQCGRDVELRINPDLVGEVADETGAISTHSADGGRGGGGGRGGCGSRTTQATITSPAKPSSSSAKSPFVNAPPATPKGPGHSTLLWTDEAWTQLLGRSSADVARQCEMAAGCGRRMEENWELLRYLEQRLCWMRVILLIGWTGEWGGGRVAVLRVEG